VYRTSSIQLFSAELGQGDEDSLPVHTASLNQRSFLHSRQLMREATLIPGQHAGQHLLPHLTFARASEARQYSEFRTRESGRLGNVPPYATEHILVHEQSRRATRVASMEMKALIVMPIVGVSGESI